jgi:ribonuclease HII
MPDLRLELGVRAEFSVSYVAGLDEAGRGAIAGPVVAAAVILPLDRPELRQQLAQVNDSKQLTSTRREATFDLIVAYALTSGVGRSSAAEIDQMGIMAANRLAMRRAIAQLDPVPQFLLLDGRMRLPAVVLPQRAIVRGDTLSLSIAAASILAKVSRDREMIALDEQYPLYGFRYHKGYCTRAHEAALQVHGPCPRHRHTFAPIRQPLL